MANVSFQAPTDYSAEQADIERRRAYAQAMSQQGMTPLGPTEQVGGFAIRKSPFEGMAKMLQSYGGRRGQELATEEQKKLAQQSQADAMRWYGEQPTVRQGSVPGFPGEPDQPTGQPVQPTKQEQMAWLMRGSMNPSSAPIAQLLLAQQMKLGDPYSLKEGEKRYGPDGQVLATNEKPKNLHFADTGAGIQGLDPTTGLPVGGVVPKAQTPDSAASLAQAERHWNSISPYQREQLKAEGAKIGISGQQLLLHRLQVDPFNQFNTQGVGGGGYGAPSGPVAPAQPGLPPQQPGAPVGPPQQPGMPPQPQQPQAGLPSAVPPNSGPPGTPNVNASNAGLSGEEYLKTLPPAVASQVKQMAEGKLPITGMSMRNPQMMAMLNMAAQYEPGFDATMWKRRNETETAFSKGKQGDAIRNAEQALTHADLLSKRIEELNNPGILPGIVNPVLNYAQEKGLGDVRQGNFRQTAQALSSELRKLFAGSGGGGLTELQQWENSLPENASRDQQRAYLKNGINLLHGGLSALSSQYRQGMGPNADLMQRLSPESRTILGRLEGGGGNTPMYATNGQERIMSMDGGKTWVPAK